jgi:hypothetical protein
VQRNAVQRGHWSAHYRAAYSPSGNGDPRNDGNAVTTRGRVLSFGSAVALMVAGAIAGAIIGGVAGEAIAIGTVSIGAIGVVSLIFLEVGLSEDHAREREAREAQRARRSPRPPLHRRRR